MPEYTHSFIKETVVRLDFAAPIPAIAKGLPKTLISVISPLFPISEPRAYIGKELSIAASTGSAKQVTTMGTDWLFHTKERDATLTVTTNNVGFSFHKPMHFEQMKLLFLPVAVAVTSNHNDLQFRRLGLRYINEISLTEADPLNWDKYINAALLASLRFPLQDEPIARAFNNIEINFGNTMLRLQYGIFNPDYPAPIRKKVFILDYDAYIQAPQTLDDIKANVEECHRIIGTWFERSITDDLRNIMR